MEERRHSSSNRVGFVEEDIFVMLVHLRLDLSRKDLLRLDLPMREAATSVMTTPTQVFYLHLVRRKTNSLVTLLRNNLNDFQKVAEILWFQKF